MKLEKSIIMKNAWTLKRRFELTTGLKALFSECLKEAWKLAKEFGAKKSIKIKDWFLNKNFTASERYLINTSIKEITKETEKAVLIKCSDFNSIWIPKSCLA